MRKNQAHPLFPGDDERDPPVVELIHITRAGSGTCPRAFAPDELQSLEQVHQWFGGGTYTIIARDHQKITGKVTHHLPGKARPLTLDEETAEAPPAAALPAQVAAAGGMSEQLIVLLLQMMQQQSQHSTEVLVALLQNKGNDTDRMLAMMQESNRQAQQNMAQHYTAMIEAAGKLNGQSGSQLDSFLRGMEHAKDMVAANLEDEDESGDVLADVVEFMNMAKQGAGLGVPGAVPGTPAQGPPPGTTPPPNGGRPAPKPAAAPAAAAAAPAGPKPGSAPRA